MWKIKEIETGNIFECQEQPVFTNGIWECGNIRITDISGSGYAVIPTDPTPVDIPAVSPRQVRQALTQVGLRNAVETAVATSSQDTKDWWEFATQFERCNPEVVAMGIALGQTNEQLDNIWIIAGSL